VRKKENDTTTLDLRWGLTAEVKEGKARRLGKVIPYKRSELLAVELMEHVCDSMKDFGVYKGVLGESQLVKMSELGGFEDHKMNREDVRKELKGTERQCEELIDEYTTQITSAIRDGLNHTEFVDAICYGESGSSCGMKRAVCQPGSYSDYMGLAPCHLCARGSWQSADGSTKCVTCPENHNSSGKGAMDRKRCVPECAPGTYSKNGLDMSSEGGHNCTLCEAAQFQDKSAKKECVKCPDGKNTNEIGASSVAQCIDKCGDAMKTTAEGCDDGNLDDHDGCSSACVPEPGSKCQHTSKGMSTCRPVRCGDGMKDNSDDSTIDELCDDGNTAEGDGCSATCTIEALSRCDAVSAASRVNVTGLFAVIPKLRHRKMA